MAATTGREKSVNPAKSLCPPILGGSAALGTRLVADVTHLLVKCIMTGSPDSSDQKTAGYTLHLKLVTHLKQHITKGGSFVDNAFALCVRWAAFVRSHAAFLAALEQQPRSAGSTQLRTYKSN